MGARESPPTELQVLPVAEPPLDREALLLAVVHAASDFALSRDDQAQQRELGGKRFAIALRFGCPNEAEEARSWTFDAGSRVLRIRVESELSGKTPIISSLRSAEVESVEGFWVRRAWMLEPACLAPANSAAPTSEGEQQTAPAGEDRAQAPAASAQAEPRVAIAQFFTSEDSRAQRRNDRPYETTVQLGEGQRPSSDGYDLVLSGRFSPLPDGRVIACAGGKVGPPSCVVSAAIDHVAVRSPEGETLAEWSRS